MNTILTQLQDGILIITINRPDKLNALNREVINELSTVLDQVYQDSSIQSAIITGAGEKAFVAGADISEFPTMSKEQGAELARRGQEMVFNKIENCPKPIIAAVNGFALGGGCELAMACHFRTTTPKAKFGQPEVNLGLIPGYGGTQRLVHLIGKGKAMELLMTADMISGEEAVQLGLANHLFAPEELIEKTIEIAKKINTKAPLAIAKIIKLVNDAANSHPQGFNDEIEAFGDCFATEDMREGTSAFLEKRAARFKGK